MPKGDHTGPMGMGPKTGRGAGYCNGFAAPGCATQPGARFGGGYGCGRGHGHGFHRSRTADSRPGWGRYAASGAPAYDAQTALRNQAEALEAQLRQIRQQLNDSPPETE